MNYVKCQKVIIAIKSKQSKADGKCQDVGVVILNKIVSEILTEEEEVRRKTTDITMQTSQKFQKKKKSNAKSLRRNCTFWYYSKDIPQRHREVRGY